MVQTETVARGNTVVRSDTGARGDTVPPGRLPGAGHQLYFWPAADAALDTLAADAGARELYGAVVRNLRRLSSDPFSRRLGTSLFKSPELGGICATPLRVDDWYVFWQRGLEPGTLEVVLIHRLPLNQPN